MTTYVKFDYFTFYTGGRSYIKSEPIPIYMNMNTYYPLGECHLVVRVDDYLQKYFYYGVVESDEEFDPELYFYYLREEDDHFNLSFKGINLSAKRLTKYYYWKWRWRYYPYRLVITEPPYLWKHLIIDEIPGGYKEAVILPMF